jgi:hypothetical protein
MITTGDNGEDPEPRLEIYSSEVLLKTSDKLWDHEQRALEKF